MYQLEHDTAFLRLVVKFLYYVKWSQYFVLIQAAVIQEGPVEESRCKRIQKITITALKTINLKKMFSLLIT